MNDYDETDRQTVCPLEKSSRRHDVAAQLIKLLGASGAIPGAIGAEDIPAGVNRLRQQLQMQPATPIETANTARDKDDETGREPQISLATRAGPLIDILQRAAAANAPVMWEKA